MKKTIFIIPGYGHTTKDKWHKWMAPFFKSKDFIVKEVPIKWTYRVMSDYVEEFKAFYLENKGDKNYVFGFSFGAMIAFLSAPTLKPNKLFLCSLSPYFKEDLKNIDDASRKFFGVRQLKDLENHSATKTVGSLKIPITIFYGEGEVIGFPSIAIRTNYVLKNTPKTKVVVVSGAKHEINHPNYIEAIKREFK